MKQEERLVVERNTKKKYNNKLSILIVWACSVICNGKRKNIPLILLKLKMQKTLKHFTAKANTTKYLISSI